MGIDEQLISRLADRDKQALSEIYDRYHLLVWNFARRLQANPADCEKLVEQVFIELWTHPEEFKKGRKLAFVLIEYCKSKTDLKESC